jgi:hypothetical protein
VSLELAGLTLMTPMSASRRLASDAPPALFSMFSARVRASFDAADSISIFRSPSLV